MIHVTHVNINSTVPRWQECVITASWHGNALRIIGSLCGDSISPRWFPSRKPAMQNFGAYFVVSMEKRWIKNELILRRRDVPHRTVTVLCVHCWCDATPMVWCDFIVIITADNTPCTTTTYSCRCLELMPESGTGHSYQMTSQLPVYMHSVSLYFYLDYSTNTCFSSSTYSPNGMPRLPRKAVDVLKFTNLGLKNMYIKQVIQIFCDEITFSFGKSVFGDAMGKQSVYVIIWCVINGIMDELIFMEKKSNISIP